MPEDTSVAQPEAVAEPQDSYNSDIVADSTPTEPAKAEPVEPAKAEPEATPEATPNAKPDAVKIPYKFMDKQGEMTVEEATPWLQKGMNYERAIEKARQESRDAYIAEQGYVWNNKEIKTEAEYKQALYEKELIDKGHSPEEIKKLVDESPAVKKANEIVANNADAEAKAATQKDQIAFLEWFKTENGRDFDTAKDTIPTEVWEANNKGVPLVNAYAVHALAEARQKIKAMEQKAEVAKKTPVGSATAHGSAEVAEEDPFLQGFNSVK